MWTLPGYGALRRINPMPTLGRHLDSPPRRAAVAGAFYPAAADTLREMIETLLAACRGPILPPPKALIVPHAGYIYSGAIAATAYRQLRAIRTQITKVVLLGPAHREYVRGIAVPGANAFETPLGLIAVDTAARDLLIQLAPVQLQDSAHAEEHALEVQLPFLQTALKDFVLLPLVVGHASAEEVREVLESVWGGPETLIVISSDLSHFLAYETACRRDLATVTKILEAECSLNHEEACGATPINGFLLAAAQHQLHPELLALQNSADTAGDRRRVVGYCAIAYRTPQAHRGAVLLKCARAAIADAVGIATEIDPRDEWLATPAATFVTLKKHGRLRGCIGSLDATRSLRADVMANAVAAALHDPRFPPVTAEELAEITLEVSELSVAIPMRFTDEQAALSQLRPGLDGVVFECEGRHATFLPQIWEQLPSAKEFMAHLKQKAGVAAAFWSAQVRLSRYTVDKWSEQ